MRASRDGSRATLGGLLATRSEPALSQVGAEPGDIALRASRVGLRLGLRAPTANEFALSANRNSLRVGLTATRVKQKAPRPRRTASHATQATAREPERPLRPLRKSSSSPAPPLASAPAAGPESSARRPRSSALDGTDMLTHLRRLFRPTAAQPSAPAAAAPQPIVEMHWFGGTRQPIPDWERIAAAERADWTIAERDAFWTAAAEHWLRALADALGPDYRVQASERFLLLTAMEPADAQTYLKFCETARRRIVRNLGALAQPIGGGKHVCLVFIDEDEYYDYIAHYYPDGGEYAMSAGVFLSAGYGHFALCESHGDAMQPTIAHELTHALLAHLPIPTWLNEGMAVNTEHSLFPQLAHPANQLYTPKEIERKHEAFWNAERIQEFWSGAAFHRTDDGNLLSYDLAKKMVGLAAHDHAAFVPFVLAAHRDDGGAKADEHLGYPVGHLVEAVLGEGEWGPQPLRWNGAVQSPTVDVG